MHIISRIRLYVASKIPVFAEERRSKIALCLLCFQNLLTIGLKDFHEYWDTSKFLLEHLFTCHRKDFPKLLGHTLGKMESLGIIICFSMCIMAWKNGKTSNHVFCIIIHVRICVPCKYSNIRICKYAM